MRQVLAGLTLAGSLFVVAAGATTIDFEAQGASAPNSFNGRLNSPLTIGIATFTGGQLLRNEASVSDETAVYATTSVGFTVYSDPLTITFSQPVNNFSLLLVNNFPDIYTLADDRGGSDTLSADGDTSLIYSLSDPNVTTVTLTSTATIWDFAIDNVSFTPTVAPVPEPVTFLPAGAFLAFSILRRRRKATP